MTEIGEQTKVDSIYPVLKNGKYVGSVARTPSKRWVAITSKGITGPSKTRKAALAVL